MEQYAALGGRPAQIETEARPTANNGWAERPTLPDVSVIVPVKNEQHNVWPLACEVVAALRGRSPAFELVFVDDGSEDATWAQVLEASATFSEVRGIRQRRSFGKAAALATGMEAARGAVVVTMDGDLQDDPGEIPRLLECLSHGYDMVSGWKRSRKDPATKRIASRLFNRAVRRFSGLALHDFNCGFKAYSAAAGREVALFMYGELHRYLPVFLATRGYRVTELEVNHRPRVFGKSKYGLGRMPRGACDLLTATLLTRYRYRPLHAFGGMAASIALFGVATLSALLLLGHHAAALVAALLSAGFVVSTVGAGLACELIVNVAGPPAAERQISEAVVVSSSRPPEESGRFQVSRTRNGTEHDEGW